ncbi:MAG: tetratricopeptide repeat protein [Bacteroidota bacterium]
MNNRVTIAFVVLLVVFLAGGLSRLNDLSVYTDSTRYLIWGHSLAQGSGFVDATRPVPTRFVMNAPLYSVLLVPVEVIFPLSLTAAKIWTTLWAAAGLLLFFLWLRTYVRPLTAFAGTLLLALNPLFFIVSTEVLSEAPFFALSIAILWLFDRFLAGDNETRTRWLLFGSLALVTLLREAGSALVLSALIILFRQKKGKEFLIIGGSAIALFLIWSIRNALAAGNEPGEAANVQFLFSRFVTGPDESLLAEFESRFWLNLKGYVLEIGALLFYPIPHDLIVRPSGLFESWQSVLFTLKGFLTFLGAGLTLYGIKLDNPANPPGLFRLITLLCYCAIILFYPVHDIRFLLPLLPLIIFYCLRGVEAIGEQRIPATIRTKAGLGLLVLVAFPNVITDYEIIRSNLGYRADPAGFMQSSSEESRFGQPWSLLGDWIIGHVPEDAVIASPAKELAPFVGSRKILETSRALPAPILERLLRDHTASYLVSTIVWDDFETFAIAMMESSRLWFEPVHKVANLTLYRVHSLFLTPRPVAAYETPDTSTVKGKILAGRQNLHQLRFDSALAFFNTAAAMAPRQPEPLFQLMTVLSILGDSASTMELNERLFTMQQATVYSALAQAQIGAMTQLLRAEREIIPQRSYTAFEAGLAYWTLGLRSTGLAVMRNIAKSDSTHFSAALWGCHYAKQLGDTTESDRFLKRVKRIDFAAPIIADWDAMRQLEERIKRTRSAVERAGAHRKIAQIYSKLELYDEALDALERALRIDPADIDVLLERAEVFESKRARWAAMRTYEHILDIEPHNSFARERLDSLAR